MAGGTHTGGEVSAACIHSRREGHILGVWLISFVQLLTDSSSLAATAVYALMLNYPPCRKELDVWMIPVLADICCEVSDAHSRASKSVETSDATGR